MKMNSIYFWSAVLVSALVTFILRLAPFVAFKSGKTPQWVQYLGMAMPPAIIALLVIYCLKGMSFSTTVGWLPHILSVTAVAILHKLKGSMLLSIAAGTSLYMFLIRVL